MRSGCPQADDSIERDNKRVEEAKEKAKARIKAENPDLTEDDLEFKFSEAVKAQKSVNGAPHNAAHIALFAEHMARQRAQQMQQLGYQQALRAQHMPNGRRANNQWQGQYPAGHIRGQAQVPALPPFQQQPRDYMGIHNYAMGYLADQPNPQGGPVAPLPAIDYWAANPGLYQNWPWPYGGINPQALMEPPNINNPELAGRVDPFFAGAGHRDAPAAPTGRQPPNLDAFGQRQPPNIDWRDMINAEPPVNQPYPPPLTLADWRGRQAQNYRPDDNRAIGRFAPVQPPLPPNTTNVRTDNIAGPAPVVPVGTARTDVRLDGVQIANLLPRGTVPHDHLGIPAIPRTRSPPKSRRFV